MTKLSWAHLHDCGDLMRARVKVTTADGYEATLFILNAREESWDVQTVDHSVLAHGSSATIERAQECAEEALASHIQSIMSRYGF